MATLLGACRAAGPPESLPVQAPPPRAAPPPAPSASTASAAPQADGVPCGDLGCRLFDSPELAFAYVLSKKPRMLAVGESHAPKGSEGVESSVSRFKRQLLPMLEGKASDILVELMLPPKGCKPEEQAVREHQKEVTEQQAGNNQNEYVELGEAARKLGIVPDALRPTCADLDAASKAGDGAVLVMLATIGRLTRDKATELLARDARVSPESIVVTYGGAMHNDVAPREDRKDWSFGPALVAASGGRYVELDVFVPEYFRDNDTWRALEFYPHYDGARFGDKTVLFQTRAESFVMVFPRSGGAAPPR